MGFRNKGDARRLRIDALEDDVAERDEEIARLKLELQKTNQRKPKKRKRKKRAEGSASGERERASVSVPDRDTWELDVRPLRWSNLVVFLGLFGGMGLFLIFSSRGDYRTVVLGAACVALGAAMGATTAARQRLELDRINRTVTIKSHLLLTWKRTVKVTDTELLMTKQYMQPKHGSSWTQGTLVLGGRTVCKGKEAAQRKLGRQVASFLGLSFDIRTPTAEEIEKRALRPLMFVFGVTAIAMAVAALLNFLG